MLMLMCARRAVQVDRWTRDGDWRARDDALNLQVAGEMLRVLRGERPEVLVNPDVWPRLGQR